MSAQLPIEWRPWCNVEALYLGEIIVGRVSAPQGGHGGKRARGVFNLDAVEYVASWHTYPTIDDAKAAIEARLTDWLQRAGIQ
ncbi:hypothetical protein [Porphyrobacter sp. YT40]|uniref:hypothetical protein n=1 Tax=Porphyrobacter sp. YT40 TaxID=2547601 RepID=UPI001144C3AA|nr:hypothetical protein [Porphyrobacter sp. YT40]QDH34010.1 hypothetical protein E2E27_06470 [Porphyrobacter sp. YT40]